MRARVVERGVLITVACLMVAAVVLPASAARILSLSSNSLTARSFFGGVVTPILDTFSSAPGTSISNTLDACGDAWTVTGGSFNISPLKTAISVSNALVTATVPLCNAEGVNESVGGDIHSNGSSLFGLLINSKPGGRGAMAVLYSNAGAGSVRLERLDEAGIFTTLATVTGTGGGNATRFLRVLYKNGVYTVSVNNVVVLSYTVTSSSLRSAIEQYNNVGIVAVSDTKSSFDNFQAYSE